MKAICLVDTSIFCELLRVPNMSQRHQETRGLLAQKVRGGEQLLLPITTVLETGNHIGQNGSGEERWQAARRFAVEVKKALEGESPFIPAVFFEKKELTEWLEHFPEWTKSHSARGKKGSGFGDLTIVKLFEQQCASNQARRVYIWSLDEHLSGYDQSPSR